MDHLGYKATLDNIRIHPYIGILDQDHLEAFCLHAIYGSVSWNLGNLGILVLGCPSLEFGNMELQLNHFKV
jgi:hypothetical protein